MKSSAVFVACICIIIETAFSQQLLSLGQAGTLGNTFNPLGGANPTSLGGFGSFSVQDTAAIAQLPITGPYGGVGTAEMSVAGNFEASGQTLVTGQVPVIGTVQFSGSIPAGGVVSIAGNCGCGSLPV